VADLNLLLHGGDGILPAVPEVWESRMQKGKTIQHSAKRRWVGCNGEWAGAGAEVVVPRRKSLSGSEFPWFGYSWTLAKITPRLSMLESSALSSLFNNPLLPLPFPPVVFWCLTNELRCCVRMSISAVERVQHHLSPLSLAPPKSFQFLGRPLFVTGIPRCGFVEGGEVENSGIDFCSSSSLRTVVLY